jgi:hypothetical protein
MAEKRVIELEVKTTGSEKAEKSAKTLKQQYAEAKRELQDMALAYGENSEQAIKAARRAGELKDVIDDTSEAIKNLQGGGTFSAVTNSLSGVVGGFGAVQGAINLVGVESEEVEKALLKLQSVMAISEGLRSVEDLGRSFGALRQIVVTGYASMSKAAVQQAVATGTATTAQKIMNTVMKANPVLLIVTGIMALVGAYALLSRKTENLEEKNEKLNKSYEESNKQIEILNNQASNRIKNNLALLESAGATEKEIFQERLNLIEQEEKARQNQLDIEFKYLAEKHKAYDKANKRGNDELKETISKEIKDTIDKIESLKRTEDDYVTSKIVLSNQYSAFLKTKQKEEIEEAKRRRDEKIKIAEEEAKRIKELRRKDLQELNDIEEQAHLSKLEKLKSNEEAYAEAVAEARKLNIESALSDEEKELLAITNKYAKIEELGELNKDLIEAKLNEENEIKSKYAQAEIDTNEAKNEAILESDKVRRDAQWQIAQSTFDGLNSLGQIFIKDQKKMEKFQKATALVQIGIDTAKAISSLVAASNANPANAVTFGAAGVSQFLTGIAGILANIAKAKQILSSSSSGGGSVSGGSGGGGSSTPNQVTTPNFNLVGQSNASSLGLQTAPLQAYVVSGEVTSQQALDRNRLKNATFG